MIAGAPTLAGIDFVDETQQRVGGNIRVAGIHLHLERRPPSVIQRHGGIHLVGRCRPAYPSGSAAPVSEPASRTKAPGRTTVGAGRDASNRHRRVIGHGFHDLPVLLALYKFVRCMQDCRYSTPLVCLDRRTHALCSPGHRRAPRGRPSTSSDIGCIYMEARCAHPRSTPRLDSPAHFPEATSRRRSPLHCHNDRRGRRRQRSRARQRLWQSPCRRRDLRLERSRATPSTSPRPLRWSSAPTPSLSSVRPAPTSR